MFRKKNVRLTFNLIHNYAFNVILSNVRNKLYRINWNDSSINKNILYTDD